jgi:outer membrane biosynthesis protein TonB
MDEENAFTAHKRPSPVQPKVGSTERGHKHDIKHTATGRIVTRRVDDQGNSVGADDDSAASGEKRGRGRPKGTKQSIGAKGPSGKSKLMTREGDVDVTDQGEYDQEGDMAKDDIKTIVRHAQALSKVLGDDDNLPEWVQSKLAKIEGMMISIDEYMQNQEGDDDSEEPIAEKAVSKKQQKFMGMVHAAQKGEKPASKEVGKVAKTMKKKDAEDFAKTKHKGLPEKAPKKKKEEDVEESTTSSGAVATSSATTGSKGGVFGKGIYDSMNFELEQMIAESMSINMSDSTEGGKSLSVTATDDDAMKLAMMLKSAGIGGGDQHGGDMHSHGEEPCDTCGMPDCGCGDVQEAVDENSPDWPTNTETSDDALQYAGGLNKPKTDVAGDGQTTIPNTAVHTQDEDALRRMMEMAGLAEAAKPDFLDMDKDGDKEESMKDAVKDKEEVEEDFLESIQRMREIAGIQEAKKPDFLDMDKDGDKKEPMSKAIKDKEEKKVDESIFALTNQWQAYKG